MPSTAQAALVFLVVILPGFLAQGGYRLGRAVPEHPQGLVAVARVIAISALIALIAWKLGGQAVYQDARAGTALTDDEAHTYRFAIGMFVLPGLFGYVLGQLIDAAARRLADAVDHLPQIPEDDEPRESFYARLKRKTLVGMSARVLHEGPTTWDRTWRRLRRMEPYAYARVVTKGGREIIGVVDDGSRVALSPQPRDVYLREILRQGRDGRYYPTAFGLGAFVSGEEIESIEWVSHEGLFRTAESNV